MTREGVDVARRSWLGYVPVVVFVGLVGLFVFALQAGDPSRLPSALIGKPVPTFVLPGVAGLKLPSGQAVPGMTTSDFGKDKVVVINVWASWCVPCTREHPQLVALSKRAGVEVFGINYKDKAIAARRFLGRFGNPFTRVGADAKGRASVSWGLTGVPETFVVNGRGVVTFKFVGELTPVVLEKVLLPAIAKARTS